MKKHLIDPDAAKAHGIALDERGWPTTNSLQEWHAKNNPQFFTKEEKKEKPEFSIPLWIIPLLPIVVLVILILK